MKKQKYYDLILNDLGKDFNYLIKEGWDYIVYVVNNSIIYRFPKNEKDINELKKEKKILDILKLYITIGIPEIEIIGGIGFKYNIIKGHTLEKRILLDLNKNILDTVLDDIVLFLKELHGIPVNFFNFLKSERIDYNIYRDKFKNEMDIRLKGKVKDFYIEKLKLYIDDLFSLNFEENVLVHTDIQAKNIIFDYKKNKISGIIDFSDCRISGKENDFVHFLDWGEDIFNKIIIKYLGYYDENFVNTIKFLHKKPLIFEIMNDDIYNNEFDYLYKKIINF